MFILEILIFVQYMYMPLDLCEGKNWPLIVVNIRGTCTSRENKNPFISNRNDQKKRTKPV